MIHSQWWICLRSTIVIFRASLKASESILRSTENITSFLRNRLFELEKRDDVNIIWRISMSENKKDLVKVVENGEEKEISQQELNEKKEGATRVVEGNDGKPHILKRMNG